MHESRASTPPGEDTSDLGRNAAPSEPIGARVRELRLARGWSQQRLADETGLCKDAISRIERGSRKPRLETLNQIAEAIGFPLTKLVDFQEAVPHRKANASRARLLQRLLDELDPRFLEAVIPFIRALVRIAPERRSWPLQAGGRRSPESREARGPPDCRRRSPRLHRSQPRR